MRTGETLPERTVPIASATGLHARPAAAAPAPKAVRDNVSAVFAKLQEADRAQAIIQAREAGLGR